MSRRWQIVFVAACLFLPGVARASTFQLGVWADDARASGCVEVPPGGCFTLHGWAFVSDDLGLGYATYRFLFPDNVERDLPTINGAIMVLDGETGLLRAILGANWVTAFRTAALSAGQATIARSKVKISSDVFLIIGLL